MDAFLITSTQFNMLDDTHPSIRKGAVVDDRNIRGEGRAVMEAARDMVAFEYAAGLPNHPDKFTVIGTSEVANEWAKTQTLDGHVVKVLKKHKLVGNWVTSSSTPIRQAQDERLDARLRAMRSIAQSCACQSPKQYSTTAAGVSTALYGNVWALPSLAKVKTLTTAVVGALYEGSGHMRCVETVLGILHDPCMADPAVAIVTRAFIDLKRAMGGCPQYSQLLVNTAYFYQAWQAARGCQACLRSRGGVN